MREGWQVTSLGEIGKVSMCKRIFKEQTSNTGEIPFYKIGTFGKAPNAFISKEIYDEFREKYSFPKKGDILISASGTIGRRVVYDGEPAYFQDSNIVWIDNNEEKVLNEFLYVFYGFCDWNPSKGATISRLYNSDLRSIKIPIPPLPEQKAIVALLDSAFAKIDKAKANIEKNIANAKELFQSKLNEIFSQRGDGWEEKTLGEVCEKTKNIKWGDNSDQEFKYIDLSSVSRNSLKVENFSIVNSNNAPSRARKIIEKGDVIFATTRPTLKRATVILEKFNEQICSTGFCVLRPKESGINSKLIFYFLQTSIFMERMEALQRGASYPAVSDSDVKGSVFMIPFNKDIQEEISIDLDKFDQKIRKIISFYLIKLQNLEDLKKSLLQKAFAGELTHSEISV